jgi:hypothetical protein
MKPYFLCLSIAVVGLARDAGAQPVSDMIVSPSIGTAQLFPSGNQGLLLYFPAL